MRVLVLQLGSLCQCWLQHVRMAFNRILQCFPTCQCQPPSGIVAGSCVWRRLDYVLVTGLSSLGCLVNLSCLDPTYILCY
jgi:hypothetical protein